MRPTSPRGAGTVLEVTTHVVLIRDTPGQIWLARQDAYCRPVPGDQVVFDEVDDDPRALLATNVVVVGHAPEARP